MTGLTQTDITQMNVADIRKSLNMIRKAWEMNSPHSPMLPSTSIMNEVTISRFCFHFVLGHHTKRHNKLSKKS